jgi:hypothetical protein
MYVRGSSAVSTGPPLSILELQEGLMAGFGARARRKHMQRYAIRQPVAVPSAEAASSAPQISASQKPLTGEGSGLKEANLNDDAEQTVSGGSQGTALAASITDRHSSYHCEQAVSSTGTERQGQSAQAADAAAPDGSQGKLETFAHAHADPDPDGLYSGPASQSHELLQGEQDELANGAAARPERGPREVGSGGHMWHGKRVVDRALQRGGEAELGCLMASFRQCFVNALQPRHLSLAWQIDHRCAPTLLRRRRI